MRLFAAAALILLSIVDLSWSQVDVGSTKTANLPMFRPVLIGNGPDALINRIDAAGLMKAGQKDAAIMFSCSVKRDGTVSSASTYRGTPDSKLLEQELLKKLAPAANPKMIPAIYNHVPVDAVYYGTVTLMVVDGKPRLRIFSNQEHEELKNENDFIAPQPFSGADSKFSGFHYPPRESAPVAVDGLVEVAAKIDANGNLQELRVLSEQPPFLGFGEAALNDLKVAKFIPGFRNGKPVASDVRIPVFYREEAF